MLGGLSRVGLGAKGRRSRGWLFLLALLLGMALAQGGLYGPEAPSEVAWLRVLNATGADGLAVGADGEGVGHLAHAEASPYLMLQPGTHRVAAGERSTEVEAAAESFTTVVALPSGLLVIADTPLRDISRGLLSLYNLTELPALELRAADGTLLLQGVGPGEVASLAVNEAEVALEVYQGSELVGSLEPQLYRRGEAHGVIVLPGPEGPEVGYLPTTVQD